MEPGLANGDLHTNHDRDHDRDLAIATKVNGITGSAAPTDMTNGVGGYGASGPTADDGQHGHDSQTGRPTRMNDLPDEIQHITSNFVPLGFMLQRLAQKTHNNLQDVIRELARKPVAGMSMNGNADANSTHPPPTDDGSIENVEKKKMLLEFARSEHTNWVKALVITEWSKKAEQISKLIDLENHMFEEELVKYEQAVFTMLNLKRNLNGARVPSPDLKTALQVLSQGTAPWMPDLGFIQPTPMTPEEQLKWLDDISTLLSLRLNLEDHDTIPYHFHDFSVASGRATFKVPGEFEVDLTLASDDFSEQLWFLDFRFLFSPAPPDMTDNLRQALEDQTNLVLANEGLPGCYRFLHEYVLSHKINEIRRQAQDLGRGRWIETLKVEQLRRAVAVQYWSARNTNTGLKSWFLIGVHSGRDPEVAVPDEKTTSRLTLRWFRDNKEVPDAVIPVGEGDEVSAEKLLQTVVALHIEHILSSIHTKLEAKPMFAKRLATMRLHVSRTDPTESFLEVQLSHRDFITVKIDPVTGLFAMVPQSRIVTHSELRINMGTKDPVEEGFAMLDSIRCLSAQEDLGRRSKSSGWSVVRGSVVKPDELRQVVNLRDTYQVLWLKRDDWDPSWHVLASLSLSGDRWWIVQVGNGPSGPRINCHIAMPLGHSPSNIDDTFFSDLTIFAIGIMSQLTDAKELSKRKTTATASRIRDSRLSGRVKFPALSVRLSELLSLQPKALLAAGASASGHGVVAEKTLRSGRSRTRMTAWTTDFVHIIFRGIDVDTFMSKTPRRIGVLAEARLVVLDRSKFKLLSGQADRDMAFNARTGQFCLYLRAEVGQPMIETLASRLMAIERLVGFLDAIRREKQYVRSESVMMSKLKFSYGVSSDGAKNKNGTNNTGGTATSDNANDSNGPAVPTPAAGNGNNSSNTALLQRRWSVSVDLSQSSFISLQLEAGCPHLRVVDYLNRVASDPATFDAVPFFLATTLSLHRALDRMEDSWEPIVMRNGGMLGIFPRALDWVVVRFVLPGPQGRPRQLVLEIRLRIHGGENWWQIRRVDNDPAHEDDLSRALKKVFDGRGQDWRGLVSAAVASPFSSSPNDGSNPLGAAGLTGVEECLGEIDDIVRTLLATPMPNMSLAQLQQRRAQAQAAQAQHAAQQVQQQQTRVPQAQTARMG